MADATDKEQEIVEEEEQAEVEAPEEVEEEQAEEAGEEEIEEEEAPEERKPSRRESLRIQALVAKLKAKEDVSAARPEGLNYKDTLDADDETITQLEKDRKAYGESRYSEGVQQAESIKFHTRLEIDAPKVESKYPLLDKESSKFNPVVADAINNWYLSTVGYNSKTGTVQNADVRYKDFVDGIMELSDEMASEKVVATKKNIAKQAATTGLRPSGGTAKRLNLNQEPGSMSDEELDAKLAQLIPKK